jgi:hypothetical protein
VSVNAVIGSEMTRTPSNSTAIGCDESASNNSMGDEVTSSLTPSTRPTASSNVILNGAPGCVNYAQENRPIFQPPSCVFAQSARGSDGCRRSGQGEASRIRFGRLPRAGIVFGKTVLGNGLTTEFGPPQIPAIAGKSVTRRDRIATSSKWTARSGELDKCDRQVSDLCLGV